MKGLIFMKKLIASVLAASMLVVSSLPFSVSAQEYEEGSYEWNKGIVSDGNIADGFVYRLCWFESNGEREYRAYITEVIDKSATSITIPAKLDGYDVDIDQDEQGCYYPFDDLKDLQEIKVDPENRYFADIDGVLFSKDLGVLLRYPEGREGAYTIPDGTETIERMAFANAKKLTSVTLPESVGIVIDKVFSGCDALEEINGVVCIYSAGVFENCPKLKSLTIDADVPDVPNNVSSKAGLYLFDMDSLEELNFVNGNMVSRVFVKNCDALRTLDLDLQRSDAYTVVVYGCDNMEYITLSLPKSLFNERTIRISGCPNLKQVAVDQFSENLKVEFNECPNLLSTEPVLIGDLNGNDRFDVIDAVELQRYILGYSTTPLEGYSAADINQDGRVNIYDLSFLKKKILEG